MKSLGLISCVVFGAAAPAHAEIRHVQPGINIQAAINAANAGDTIFFDPGTYNIQGIILKSGQTYTANPCTVILHTTRAARIFGINPVDSNNITISGLIFDGGYLDLEGHSAAPGEADNITVTNNIFQNAQYASPRGAIFYTYLKNSHIDGNKFANMLGGTGSALSGYHADNTSITRNNCIKVHQCLGGVFTHKENTGRNVYVGYNAATGVERMGLEFQDLGPNQTPPGTTTNLVIEGNWFSDWATSDSAAMSKGLRFGLSVVLDMGIGTIVRGNYAACGTGGTCDIGMELAGQGASAFGNYIVNFLNMTEVYEPGWSVTGNNYVGANCSGNECVKLYSPNGASKSNTVVSGNTSNASLFIPPKPSAGPVVPPSCPY